MANSSHHREHDGHGHTHDEPHDRSHDAGHAAPAQGHAHGEPTGNSIEKIGFTRSQFLRMCLAGVAAGAATAGLGPEARAATPSAYKPRTDSYDDPLVFNGPSPDRPFLKQEGMPV